MACCAPLCLSSVGHTMLLSHANYLFFFFAFSNCNTRPFACAQGLLVNYMSCHVVLVMPFGIQAC